MKIETQKKKIENKNWKKKSEKKKEEKNSKTESLKEGRRHIYEGKEAYGKSHYFWVFIKSLLWR